MKKRKQSRASLLELSNTQTSSAEQSSKKLDHLWLRTFGKRSQMPRTYLERNEQLYSVYGRDFLVGMG